MWVGRACGNPSLCQPHSGSEGGSTRPKKEKNLEIVLSNPVLSRRKRARQREGRGLTQGHTVEPGHRWEGAQCQPRSQWNGLNPFLNTSQQLPGLSHLAEQRPDLQASCWAQGAQAPWMASEGLRVAASPGPAQRWCPQRVVPGRAFPNNRMWLPIYHQDGPVELRSENVSFRPNW